MSMTQTDCWNWRNETKFKIFWLMFWMLICLLKINDLMCVFDFYSSFYQTMFQRFKKMIIVKINQCRRTEKKWIIDWMSIDFNEQENRLLTKNVENSKEKIDNWLTDWFEKQKNRLLIEMSFKQIHWSIDFKTENSTIKSFRRHENVLCKFFIQLTKIRFVTSWLFRKTWIERQMNNIHRFQRKNFFINANSRSFSLIYDAHNENKML